MPEIQRSVETNDNLRESLIFGFTRNRIFLLLLLAMVSAGCASKFKYFTQDECRDYNAITYKEGKSGKHGYKKIFVFSDDGEHLCNIKERCEEFEEDEEKPEPEDCIDFSKPCEKQ